MPTDLITIKAIANELNNKLNMSRIDKISQPHNDEILLTIRGDRTNFLLVLSASTTNPRIHLTSIKKFNPYAAPSFCMLLRKHLTNAIINSINIIGDDRVVRIGVSSKNELYDTINLSIIVELMGRYSNILLLDDENKIIDALRHIPPDDSDRRIILPNIKYTLQPQTKICPTDYEGIKICLNNFQGEDYSNCIINNVGGLSNLTANEIIYRAIEINSDKHNLIDLIIEQFKIFNNICDTNIYKPCTSIEQDTVKDYYILPYQSIVNNYKYHNTINDAADIYYSDKDNRERLKSASKSLVAIVKNHIKRGEKSLSYVQERLLDTDNMQSVREYGDMVLANIYKINKGMKEITVDNYFAGGSITIPLDITLSPQQNANKFYKKYSKLARSKSILEKQIEELSDNLEYLNSLLSMLNYATTLEDIEGLKEELKAEKLIVEPSTSKVRKPKKIEPRMVLIDGFKVYCGRNNIDNDYITFKLANSNDLFLHAKNIHGSHTIIISEGRQIPNSVIEKAASIAAFYSEARFSNKVEVDYSIRRNIRKHPSGKKGMVIYTDFSTAKVAPYDYILVH